MKKQQGRKALIVLSDGVDHGSKESSLERHRIRAAREHRSLFNPFQGRQQAYGHQGGHHGGMGMGGPGGYPGGGYPGGGGGGGHRYPQQEQRPDGKKILERISKETGGRLFEVTKKQSVDQIYDQIQQELRAQYILGYVPDKSPDERQLPQDSSHHEAERPDRASPRRLLRGPAAPTPTPPQPQPQRNPPREIELVS